MYTQYFGLTEKPFAIAPNPRYLYMSELHREALAHLVYGLNSDGCIILLTGEVGTGKTTVCRCLLEQMPETTDIAIILNPRLSVSDLLKTICEELSIPVPPDSPSSNTLIDAINRHLIQAHARGRTTALVIDEAQNLEADVLEQLRLLTNLETDTQKLLRIILLGQPELRLMLAKPQMTQVSQRITSKYHLKPLQPEDVRVYIQHRLRVAGDEKGRLFSDKAVDHVIRLSKGIPRVINLLCDRALLGAYAERADHVSLQIMKKAGREIVDAEKRAFFPRPESRMVLAVLAILTIGLAVSLYLLRGDLLPLSAKQIKVHPLTINDPPPLNGSSADTPAGQVRSAGKPLPPDPTKKASSPAISTIDPGPDHGQKLPVPKQH